MPIETTPRAYRNTEDQQNATSSLVRLSEVRTEIFSDTEGTEIDTLEVVASVRCVYETAPGLRDAPLRGGTVIHLLAREQGVEAAVQFVARLHPQGARAALSQAFDRRPFVHTEGAWRSHLARIASA